MTSQLNVDTIVDKAGSGGTNITVGNDATYVAEGGSTNSHNVVQGLCKSWINVDGDASTPSIRDSLNAASLTDTATGRYQLNYTNNFSTARQQAGAGIARRSGTSRGCFVGLDSQANELRTSDTGFSVATDAGSNSDQDIATLLLMGDLA